MKNIAYVNGEFVGLEQATISIQDRGFLFGDGVYEVIKLYAGKLFKLEDHLKRLLASTGQIKLELDYSLAELKELCKQVLAQNKDNPRRESGSLYLQITRGTAPRSHSFSDDLEPNLIIYLLPAKSLPEDLRKRGVSVITIPDTRWDYCNIKTTNLLPNILGKQKAKEEEVYESIFVNNEDKVTEGTSSNIFLVQDGVIYTHPANKSILGGITRELVLELARNQFKVKEIPFDKEDLYQADEVFITSTTKEVLGVVEVDDIEISNGQIGEMTNILHKEYKNYIADFKVD
ncbi:D-amino-acid transaminase [Halanaerocella petrolearia]